MALKEKLLDRAQKYIAKGYLDKALAEYRSAADVDPRDISIRLRIGDLYVKTNRRDEAIKEYTEVARANAQRGFYLKAIAVYKQVLKLDDSILDIHYKLAELYTKQRLIADAISSYSYIVSTFEKKGKTSEVMELLKKMLEIDPDNIGIRLKLADLFQKLSFEKDALEEYALIFGKLMEQDKLDKAEKIFLALHNGKPREPVVLRGLSELYRKKGDDVKFLNFARPLLKIYADNDEIDEAKALCSAILEARPDDPDALEFTRAASPPPAGAPSKEAVSAGEAAQKSVSAEPSAEETERVAGEALISWPEEEIQVTLEGFEEGGAAPVAAEEAFKDEEEFEVSEPVAQEASAPVQEPDAVVEEPVFEAAPVEAQAVEEVSVEPGAEPTPPAGETGAVAPESAEAAPGEDEDVEIEIDIGEDEGVPVFGHAEESAPVEEEPVVEVEVPVEAAAETVAEVEESAAVEEPVAEESAPVVEEPSVEVELPVEAAAETVAEVEEPAVVEEPVAEESAPVVEEPSVEVEAPVEVPVETAAEVEEPAAIEEPVAEESAPVVEEPSVEVEAPVEITVETAAEVEEPAAVEEPVAEESAPVEEEPSVEVELPVEAVAETVAEVEESAVVEEPVAEEPAPVVEEPSVEVELPVEAAAETVAEVEEPAVVEEPVEEEPAPVVEEPSVEVELPVEAAAETVAEVEEPAAVEEPVAEEPAPVVEEPVVEAEAPVEAAVETVAEVEEPAVVEEPVEEEPAPVEEEPSVEVEAPVEMEPELSGPVEEVLGKVLADEPEEAPVADEAPSGFEDAGEAFEDSLIEVDEAVAAGPPPTAGEEAETAQQAPEVETIESPEVQDELSSAIEELKEKIESDDMILEPESVKAEEPAPEGESEYIDLSAELGMEEALEGLAGAWSRSEGESSDAFDEFKRGIGQQLSREDTETHYNLGIAYMEMELYDEASKEFKIALKDPRLEGDCYARLGLCAMAESKPDEAIVYYLKGLKVEGRTDEERNGMMYELALAYEAAGDIDEAFQLFTSIHDADPGFREVEKKLSTFDRERPYIPLDDGFMEVELL